MQDHMAVCNRWVGGRRRSKQEVIITLPPAALHLLTTWTDWNKFSNKLNINRCSSPQAQTHTHAFYHMPHLVFFSFHGTISEFAKRGNVENDIHTLRWAIELRMKKSTRLQNRRKQVQNECAYVGGVCACVKVYVYALMAACLYASAGDWVRVHFSVWGKLWQPGVFVLKFRQGSRWLFSVWLSKLASCGVQLHRLWWCHRWYCCTQGNKEAIDWACETVSKHYMWLKE